jgi:lysophospholipase L1-like esterase
MNIKMLLAATAMAATILPAIAADNATRRAAPFALAAWAAPADYVGPALQAMTIRQVVRSTVAGEAVRVRLSNLYGTAPLAISSAHIGLHAGGPAIAEGSGRALMFHGAPGVTIAPGESVLSDWAPLQVGALRQLAVSFYLPGGAAVSTLHASAVATSYLVSGKDVAGETVVPATETDDSRYFLTDVEVGAAQSGRALVVVGDSITEGIGSTPDRNARWPDLLAERVQAVPAAGRLAVINAGSAGNRVLNDFGSPYVGPSTLHRFERDALDKAGVHWIILLQGINDISASELLAGPGDKVSVAQLIEAMQSLIGRAHAKGIRIWGATLLPRAGASGPRPHTGTMEAKRLALNAWIRSAGAFDGVIDFDALMRDPAQPARLLPAFDSGDHTHPNDAGYLAMANGVDLARLLKE